MTKRERVIDYWINNEDDDNIIDMMSLRYDEKLAKMLLSNRDKYIEPITYLLNKNTSNAMIEYRFAELGFETKKWEYSVSTNTIWASFDYGVVEAENCDDAREKAIEKLHEDFRKANEALEHLNSPEIEDSRYFKLEFNEDEVTIKEVIN